jgi:hypothetical protein
MGHSRGGTASSRVGAQREATSSRGDGSQQRVATGGGGGSGGVGTGGKREIEVRLGFRCRSKGYGGLHKSQTLEVGSLKIF